MSYIEVNGRKLYCEIAGKGQPTVLLEAGSTRSSTTWDTIFPTVASFTQVFRYDRAGLGQSDPCDRPRTFVDICDDLHSLVKKAKLSPPFLLVGHSMGGQLGLVYAGRYLSDLAGLILLDTPVHDSIARSHEAYPWPMEGEDSVLNKIQQEMHTFRTQEVEGMTGERIYVRQCLAQQGAVTSLGDLPLVVLTRGLMPSQLPDGPGNIGTWPLSLVDQLTYLGTLLQSRFLALSSQSQQIVAFNSGHDVHYYEPQVVVNAIKKLVDTWRMSAGGRQVS